MQTQPEPRLSLAIRLAHAITRSLTWGLPSQERQRTLTESLADWEAMAVEQGTRRVIWRAIRGIPTGIWIRLSDRDITAMPAGIALSLVGLGGIAAGMQSPAYPSPFRHFVVLTSLGLALIGANLIREPRRLVLRSYRIAGSLVAAGFLGLATRLPKAADWPYETPLPETHLLDLAMQVGFVLIAAGFATLVAASLLSRRQFVHIAGIAIITGVIALAITQITWGIWTSTTDMKMTAAALVIGLAALSFAHVLPRLRHLEIVAASPGRRAPRARNLWKGTN